MSHFFKCLDIIKYPVSSDFSNYLQVFFSNLFCLNQIPSKVYTLQLVPVSFMSLLIGRICLPLSFSFLCNLVSKKLDY